MVKELPEDWNGTFFGKEEANAILNMTAAEFMESLLENNTEDAKFFLAGAIFDFDWNGLKEKAEELNKAASQKFHAPYEKIPEMAAFGKEKVALGLKECDARSAIYSVIGEMFEDKKRMVMN